MRAKLARVAVGREIRVIDATETLQYQETQLALQEGQLASAATGLDVVARDAEKAVAIVPLRRGREARGGRAAGGGKPSSASPRRRRLSII